MPAYTLIEVVAVMALMAVGASALAPTARRLSDRAAVTVARERVVAGISEARTGGMSVGGASVTISTDPPLLRVYVGDVVRRSARLGDGGKLEVLLGGGRDSTQIRFDALGIGRFASETILFRRGDASTTLIVSSYGRVRRR